MQNKDELNSFLISRMEQRIKNIKNYSNLPQMATALKQEQHRQNVISRANRDVSKIIDMSRVTPKSQKQYIEDTIVWQRNIVINPEKPWKTVSLNVCQGVGDTFWVYQKFSPHVDYINFNICYVQGDNYKLNTRAIEFLKLLPKVSCIKMKSISGNRNVNIVNGRFLMKGIFDNLRIEYDYACNNALENGIRLDEIDKEYAIEETVDIAYKEIALPFKDYVTIAVSGTTLYEKIAKDNLLWSVDEWVYFIELLYEKYKLTNPVILIGASYDRDVCIQLENKLKKYNYKVATYIDYKPENVIYIIKNSFLFIGYQSGLNILADNLDVKQVMIYFNHLEPMKYTWCKKKNIKTLFHADIFLNKPNKVIENLELKL